MPRFERPETSSLPDFEETVVAATWGIYDDVEDMRQEARDYEGVYPPEPQAPRVAGYREEPPLLRVIGSTEPQKY